MAENEIFKSSQIKIAAFLGGLPLGGYFIYKNFVSFNDIEKAKYTRIITVLSTIILMVIINIIPEKIGYLIPIISCSIVSLVVHYFQEKRIEECIKNGYATVSLKKSIALNIAGMIIIFASFFSVGYFFSINKNNPNEIQKELLGYINNELVPLIEYEQNAIDKFESLKIQNNINDYIMYKEINNSIIPNYELFHFGVIAIEKINDSEIKDLHEMLLYGVDKVYNSFLLLKESIENNDLEKRKEFILLYDEGNRIINEFVKELELLCDKNDIEFGINN